MGIKNMLDWRSLAVSAGEVMRGLDLRTPEACIPESDVRELMIAVMSEEDHELRETVVDEVLAGWKKHHGP